MAQYNIGFSRSESEAVTVQQASTQQRSYAMQQETQYERAAGFSMQDQTMISANYGGSDQYDHGSRYGIASSQNEGQFQRQANGAQGRSAQYAQFGTTNTLGQQRYMGRQDFEARKSQRSSSGRQFSGGWRAAQGSDNVYVVQQEYVKTSDDVESPATEMTEDEYRNWLTQNFKHLFDPFESQGGMPIDDFNKMVNESELKRTRNLNQLFKKLDKDGNNRVSWQEFFTGIKYTKKTEVSKTRKAFNSFVNGMTPVAKKKINKEKQAAAEDGEPIPEESYLEAYNCRPPPLFLPLFYIAVWIFFIIYAIELQKGPEWNRVGWEKGFPFQSPLVFCPSVREQAWRFVTYSLLHDGYHHIIFNTIFSMLLGLPLETVHKAWRVGPVFMIGVLFGSLASSIIDPGTPLIGASGGVYALIGAHYALVIMNWEELQDDWTNIRENPIRFLLSGVVRLIFLTLIVALDFGLAFYRRYSGTTTLPTSAVAHIGGLLAGVFAGVPILRNIDKKPWEGVAFIVCLVIAALMFLFGVFWNIFSQSYPAANASPCSNPALLGL